MKRLFLIFVMIFFVTGCVYPDRRSPYGYSNGYGHSSYSTITPVYPRYQPQQQYYYTPAPRYVVPAPNFRSYEERSEHRPSSRSHDRNHYDDDHNEHDDNRSNSRSRHRE